MGKMILWDVTSGCNLKCKHCYANNKYGNNSEELLPDMNFERAKLNLYKLKNMGFDSINLLGGEPLVHKHIMELIEIMHSLGFKIDMVTNGLLLTTEKMNKLIDYNLNSILISMEGVTKENYEFIRGKNTYEKMYSNLIEFSQLIKKRNSKLRLGISYTITKPGIKDMMLLPKIITENSLSILSVDGLDVDGNAEQNLSSLYVTPEETIDALENLCKLYSKVVDKKVVLQMAQKPAITSYLSIKYGVKIFTGKYGSICAAGDKQVVMENSGRLTPCGLADKHNKIDKIVANGDLLSEKVFIDQYSSFEEIQKSKFFKSFLNLKDKKTNIESCKNCDYKAICKPCAITTYGLKNIKLCDIANKKFEELKPKLWNSKLDVIDYTIINSCNDSAKYILSNLKKGQTLKEICLNRCNKTSFNIEEVENNIWKFVRLLFKFGILRVSSVC